MDSDRSLVFLIPRSWSPQRPDSGAVKCKYPPIFGEKPRLKAERWVWVAEIKVRLLVRWVEDSFRAKGLGAQLKGWGVADPHRLG